VSSRSLVEVHIRNRPLRAIDSWGQAAPAASSDFDDLRLSVSLGVFRGRQFQLGSSQFRQFVHKVRNKLGTSIASNSQGRTPESPDISIEKAGGGPRSSVLSGG
jgi:hypothetical protein